MPSAEFNKAFDEVSKLKAKPTNDEQLKLYALAKIAKDEEVKKPGMLDITGKAKFKAWEDMKKDKDVTSAADADKKYVELVTELKNKYGFDA